MSENEDNVLERAEGTEIKWTSTAKNPTVKVPQSSYFFPGLFCGAGAPAGKGAESSSEQPFECTRGRH